LQRRLASSLATLTPLFSPGRYAAADAESQRFAMPPAAISNIDYLLIIAAIHCRHSHTLHAAAIFADASHCHCRYFSAAAAIIDRCRCHIADADGRHFAAFIR